VPRSVDETEWLTRSTAPLRLARFVQTRVSSRRLQILSCAVCRLVVDSLTSRDRLRLEIAERFAFGELDGKSYRDLLEADAPEHLPAVEGGADFGAVRAVHSALSGNIKAGFVKAVDWVLESCRNRTDEASRHIPQQLCDLMRELVGNPFRAWGISPPWLASGIRVAPDGTSVTLSLSAMDLAREIDVHRRFDLLPILADELEASGCTNPGLLHHCRHGTQHLRGCWAVDLVLGRE
jgi:hypothetical protein